MHGEAVEAADDALLDVEAQRVQGAHHRQQQPRLGGAVDLHSGVLLLALRLDQAHSVNLRSPL